MISLVLSLAVLTPAAQATDLHVKTTGADASNTCTDATTPCKTIAAALVQSSTGDTVMVHAGTYSATSSGAFPLEVPAGVALVGDGADATIVKADTPLIFNINDGSSLDGLQIDGLGTSHTGVRFNTPGVATLSGLIIQNNTYGVNHDVSSSSESFEL